MNRFTIILLTYLAAATICQTASAESVHKTAALRRPIALTLTSDNAHLLAINQRTGTISVLDVREKTVLGEYAIAKRPSDICRIDGTEIFAITDEEGHKLILATIDNNNLKTISRIPVSPYPVETYYDHKRQLIMVTSLWSRRLTVIGYNQGQPDKSKVIQQIDMSFAPRKLTLLHDHNLLIVADAFGGKLALFDVKNADAGEIKLFGIREFPGHNIRGIQLSADGKMLLIAHQMLNELAHTVRNDVHWGLLMSNDLRWLRVENVIAGGKQLYSGAHMHPLGEAGSATSDPAGLNITSNGTVVVSLGGVGEVAFGQEDDFSLQRINVGRRPTDVVVNPETDEIYIANTFDDSISIIDLDVQDQVEQVSLGPKTELTVADKGELLFYDGTISHDSWMSCHSCHTDGHTNGMLNDNFSDASFGAPKRVMSLLGKTGTAPFAWNASAKDINAQIRKSIQHTMQSDEPPADATVTQIAAFLKTLKGPPSIDVVKSNQDPEAIARGQQIFERQSCNKCHTPPLYTSPKTYDVGLVDKEGNKEFNPPSLIGVGQRSPYFHDGNAKTLRDVLHVNQHPGNTDLSESDLKDLISFLRSL